MLPAPLSFRLRKVLSARWLTGWLRHYVSLWASKTFGVCVVLPELRGVYIRRDGKRFDLGVLGYRKVTTAFVNFLVDQFQTDTTEIGDFKYHDSGVGVTAEDNGDTAMETTDGEARVAGSQIEGASANIYKSVGTIAYSTTKIITEHGLFSSLSSTTLMDRTVFAAVNVVGGDSIEYTYSLTVSAGG